MRRPNGAVLFETVLLLTLLVGVGAAAHLEILGRCQRWIRQLQGERHRYDGKKHYPGDRPFNPVPEDVE